MKLNANIVLPFPREEVYLAYRDRIPEVLEFLPNVRKIDVKWREEDALGVVRQIREWHGGGVVPAAMRGTITEAMLGWTEHAIWSLKAFCCDWMIESHRFSDAIRCGGRNSFVDRERQTLVEFRGTVEVDARRLPGVPTHLARPVGRSVEEFLVGKIESNARTSVEWFEKYRADLRVTGSSTTPGMNESVEVRADGFVGPVGDHGCASF